VNKKGVKITIAKANGNLYSSALAIAEIVHSKQLQPTDIDETFKLAKEILKLKPKIPISPITHTLL